MKVSGFGHCEVSRRGERRRECCDEIKHEDKLPFSAPSQPCLLNKHCRLDSLELQSLHPESPIDPPDGFSEPRKIKKRKTKSGEMEKPRKGREEEKKEERDRLNIWLC